MIKTDKNIFFTKNIYKTAPFCLLIALSCGCAKYRLQNFTVQNHATHACIMQTDNFEIHVQTLPENMVKNEFPQYQVVHLAIKNKTSTSYTLNADNISLPVPSLEQFRKQYPHIYVENLIPCIIAFISGFLFWWTIVLPASTVLGLTAWHCSEYQNDKSMHNIKPLALFSHQKITINPSSTTHTVIFVNKHKYAANISITLTSTQAPAITLNGTIMARMVHGYKVM